MEKSKLEMICMLRSAKVEYKGINLI